MKQHKYTTAVSEGLTPTQYIDTLRQSIYGAMPCRRKIDWIYQEALSMGAQLPDGVSVYQGENIARLNRGEPTRPDFNNEVEVSIDGIDELAA